MWGFEVSGWEGSLKFDFAGATQLFVSLPGEGGEGGVCMLDATQVCVCLPGEEGE